MPYSAVPLRNCVSLQLVVGGHNSSKGSGAEVGTSITSQSFTPIRLKSFTQKFLSQLGIIASPRFSLITRKTRLRLSLVATFGSSLPPLSFFWVAAEVFIPPTSPLPSQGHWVSPLALGLTGLVSPSFGCLPLGFPPQSQPKLCGIFGTPPGYLQSDQSPFELIVSWTPSSRSAPEVCHHSSLLLLQ